jgi:carbonic anhydrase
MRSAAVVAVGLLAATAQPHWSYQGKDGPDHWSELSPQFKQCSTGHEQSPIDIRNATPADLQPLEVEYGATPLHIINSGSTIQVDAQPGATMSIGTRPYELVQFHFHAPSEEAIDGKRHAMAMHLVHKDAAGKVAMVAVLFDVGPKNNALAPLFDGLPQKPGTEVVLADAEKIHLDEVLPQRRGYFEYAGSLTTPPCSEGVRWLVLKDPVALSAEQLAAFRALYPDNARPLQPAGGRVIRQSAQ